MDARITVQQRDDGLYDVAFNSDAALIQRGLEVDRALWWARQFTRGLPYWLLTRGRRCGAVRVVALRARASRL